MPEITNTLKPLKKRFIKGTSSNVDLLASRLNLPLRRLIRIPYVNLCASRYVCLPLALIVLAYPKEELCSMYRREFFGTAKTIFWGNMLTGDALMRGALPFVLILIVLLIQKKTELLGFSKNI